MDTKKQTRKKTYKHISAEERDLISIRLAQGKSKKEIAIEIGRHPSSISRETHRNGTISHREYQAGRAQKYSDSRKKQSHKKKRLKNDTIRSYAKQKLKQGWTPEQIAGRLSIDYPEFSISHEAIYQFIYEDAKHLIHYLPRSHRKRMKRGLKIGKRGCKIKNRTMINDRPEEINSRTTAGHWEGDTIVSRESGASLLVLRERKLHFTIIVKLENKTAAEVKKSIINRLNRLPAYLRKSITFDNGTEFMLHEEIAAALNLKVYFCNPYHSWEKGSVENTNGLIRRKYPKKTDFSLISEEEIRSMEIALNSRPRKSLGYLTPFEVLQNCA